MPQMRISAAVTGAAGFLLTRIKLRTKAIYARDGFVAVRGWTENSALHFMDFSRDMEAAGVKTLICTDISRDGAMRGTNREMYRELSETLGLQITASGGVSTMEDIESLRQMNLYGAIIGKAYYTGDINLKKAIEAAR